MADGKLCSLSVIYLSQYFLWFGVDDIYKSQRELSVTLQHFMSGFLFQGSAIQFHVICFMLPQSVANIFLTMDMAALELQFI